MHVHRNVYTVHPQDVIRHMGSHDVNYGQEHLTPTHNKERSLIWHHQILCSDLIVKIVTSLSFNTLSYVYIR